MSSLDPEKQLVQLCRSTIAGEIDPIVACRRMIRLINEVQQDENEIFFPIIAAESETDHYPIGRVREVCSADYLQRMDREKDEYLSVARDDILNACREIIAHFNSRGSPGRQP